VSFDLTGELLRGKLAADSISEEIISDVNVLLGQDIYPKLVTVRVGDRDDDIAYESSIGRVAAKLQVVHEPIILAMDVAEDELYAEVLRVSTDESVHGILLFRPLPQGLNETKILEGISSAKDVDGVTAAAMLGIYTLSGSRATSGTLETSGTSGTFPTGVCPHGGRQFENVYAPCTAEAVIKLLEVYDISISGKQAVVVGRSLVIGKPVSQLLLSRNATVTIAHSKTQNLSSLTKNADIVVVCAGLGSGGRASRLGGEYFSEGQVVIDVGIHADDDGLYGDVDTEAAIKAGARVSPVPGGLGSVTTYVLMKHVVDAAKK
jgi:methylenetetrahydrofolate dehydrogenase (NADP+)/methenyltetrahydrofolate cyclohydrolase